MKVKTFGIKDYNGYWQKRRERNRTSLSEIHRIIIATIREYVKPGSKVLDLGVGPGHVFKELRKTYDCYGVEISDEAFKLYDFSADKIQKFDLNNGVPDFANAPVFDAAIASNIFHHFPDPTNLLRSIRSKMGPHSIFILVNPNVTFFVHRLKFFFKGQFPDFSPGHKNFLTPPELSQLLNQEGFRVEEIKTMGRHKLLLRLAPFWFSGALFFVSRLK